ncbi:RHS repeat protein [Salmonella enterica subsp. enterica serovar Ouagadougou]|uniref:RHS repeat protein n=3 Tax=Salmonella enterica I TaxID=59201 RepID=A0A5I0D5G1_SALET|nr:RHS repeat protein [Salmonella enterica subsp. enterica serovar Ouagadougou]EBV0637564.1 RHS repeat protein [Salmonella enterica subsp. enterica serovar Ouagadougou]EBV0756298.1 RHS repeat protein [Salmonella enterica subsp. enterica serovar Ouagadougou]EBV0947219.1 RHS repeat protein [Salmonella enterica subsp. enterica serovar Ouagadougou]EBV3435103.1 RHS repeat protein [Salmonella enterica subsp. enterica serovar Ouagadougou]
MRIQHNTIQAEGRYLYDPLGRRVGKRVWKRELVHWSNTRMELSRRPYVTWYGWEGDRLTTIQTGQSRVQTVYGPGSFTPLVRIETDAAEQAKAQHRSLAEKLSQEGSEDGQAVQLPAALTAMLDRLEGELRRNAVSEESRQWLAGCGLTPEQMAGQLEPEYTPQRKIHLYHCDQRGLPLALITPDNTVAWRGEYDEWGNLSGEENPADLEQLIRLPGQQYDEESGLYYNRYRYYNPGQGRYITQDPIGLKGGWNLYQYPLNPVKNIDQPGLNGINALGSWLNQSGMKGACNNAIAQLENSIPKPRSDWQFIRWETNEGKNYGNSYKNANVVCKEQFDNKKMINVKTFQTGWLPINEVEAGRGIPDPSEDSSDIASGTETNVDNIKDLMDAHSMAKKCGSKSNYQCFMDTEATSELGRKICKQRSYY